jgi:hypothetical protein
MRYGPRFDFARRRDGPVAGAGFAFADRSVHDLKGVPDSWQLYAVEPAGG